MRHGKFGDEAARAAETTRIYLLRRADDLALQLAQDCNNGYIHAIDFVGGIAEMLQIKGYASDTPEDEHLRIWIKPLE